MFSIPPSYHFRGIFFATLSVCGMKICITQIAETILASQKRPRMLCTPPQEIDPMMKRLALFSALAVSCLSVAHATPISGFFSANGTDNFTSSSITFDSAQVAGAISGTFASYLTDGTTISFLPGPLPYSNGFNAVPTSVYPLGYAPLFTVTQNGETFTFDLTDYTAGYITNGTNGCGMGSTCLDVTGDGFFSGTGALTGTSGPGTFVFTSQYVPGQPINSITSFSASASAMAPTPEPASLALVGSGLLGIAGFARRKFAA